MIATLVSYEYFALPCFLHLATTMTVIVPRARKKRNKFVRVTLPSLVLFVLSVGYTYCFYTVPTTLTTSPELTSLQPIELKQIDVRYEGEQAAEEKSLVIGARDEKGQLLPFFFDETALHQQPERFIPNATKTKTWCQKQEDPDYRVFQEKVVVDFDYEMRIRQSGKTRPRLLCIVYTFEFDHHILPLIRQIWGYVE